MTKGTRSDPYLKRTSVLFVPWLFWINGKIRLNSRFSLQLLLGLSISFTRAVSSQNSSFPQDRSSDNYTIRMNSNLVILSATVVDRHNALVSGLTKDDFEVYENHVQQFITVFSHEDVPVAVGLVIDNSGSMGQKRADVIAAALSFAQSSNPQDQIFIVNFNEHVSYGLPPDIPFTGRMDQLRVALSSFKAIGETALYDAIASALDHLKQSKCDKKVLIVISDGGDNASAHSLVQVIEMTKHSNAGIYAVGIFDEQDGDQNPGVLRRFAKETGGEAFFPGSSKEISSICEKIARDIRNQYTLGYIPSIGGMDTGYRVVNVRASAGEHGRLSVRTRNGYFLPLGPPAQSEAIHHDFHK